MSKLRFFSNLCICSFFVILPTACNKNFSLPVTPISPPPSFVIQWGGNGTGNGKFNGSQGVGVDTSGGSSSGDVYVPDESNNLIQKFTNAGVFLTQWGGSGTGNGTFASPKGVAIDSAGNVYVADTSNNLIQKFTSAGIFITQWGGSGAGNGKFNLPFGVAIDLSGGSSSGDVYVADSFNNLIQKFTSTGIFITQWGGSGGGNGKFNTPYGIGVNLSGDVYVADSHNNLIQEFTSSGAFIAQWGGSGTGNGKFNIPGGVSMDSSGNVYVADGVNIPSNDLIQKFTSTGSFLTQWGGSGTGNGKFNGPSGVAVDLSGNIFVADNNNNLIQKFH